MQQQDMATTKGAAESELEQRVRRVVSGKRAVLFDTDFEEYKRVDALLRETGFHVDGAQDQLDIVCLLTHLSAIDLLIVPVNQRSGLDGRNLAAICWTMHAGTKVIYTYTEHTPVNLLPSSGHQSVAMLQAPISVSELVMTLLSFYTPNVN